MIDPNRFPLPNVLAMANRLAEMKKQTELPPFEPFRAAAKVDRTDDLIAASLAAGMIAAGGTTVSAEEAAQVWREVRELLIAKGTSGASLLGNELAGPTATFSAAGLVKSDDLEDRVK